MNDTTSVYFAAATYTLDTFGSEGARYFDRVYQLSASNTLDEIKSIVDGWKRASDRDCPKAKPVPAGRWARGSAWSDTAVRVAHDRGIVWKLKCSCGKTFQRSTNDTIPDARRKCSSCQLEDELTEANQELVTRLKSTAQTVVEWHRHHDKLIWSRVHKACRLRDITDPDYANELHALVWAHIASVAGQYRDRGFKPSAWLGRVADCAIRDHFKVKANRERLAPTEQYPEWVDEMGIPNPNPPRVEERVPARSKYGEPDER